MISLPYPRRSTQTRGQLCALLTALLVGCVVTASTTAYAQDADPAQDAPAEAPESTPDAPETASDAETAESAPDAPAHIPAKSHPALEEKFSTYWSVEKDLPSVERRAYTRENRLSVGLFAGMLASQPFNWYVPVGARATYYFSNFFGIELEGSFTDVPGVLTHNTELSDYLEQERPADFTDAKREDRFLWRGSALAVWHPLYGKLALLQRKLTHFDFNLAAGLGAVGVDRPDKLQQTTESTVVPEAIFGLGVQFFATQDLVVRLDGRIYVYPAAETLENTSFFSRLEAPVEFLLGISYMF